MEAILGNHILLISVVHNLVSARDIATIAGLNQDIRSTLLLIIHLCGIERLTFADCTRLKSKTITIAPFQLVRWKDLRILNLSNTGVTSTALRSLLSQSTTLHILQIVECKKITYASLMSLFRAMDRARFDNPRRFAPVKIIDCWDISGLCVDYKYQNKAEWFYQSYCADNINLARLLEASYNVGVDLNMQFCQGSAHDNVTDIKYLPAARQTCGLTKCELFKDFEGSYCQTCILRHHNEHPTRHQCRTPVPASLADFTDPP